jgi:hypothetical protein
MALNSREFGTSRCIGARIFLKSVSHHLHA